MAELADALDLGSSEETRTGSIPARCTKNVKLSPFIGLNKWWAFLLEVKTKTPHYMELI